MYGIPQHARFYPGQCVHLCAFYRVTHGRYYPLDGRRRIRVVLFGVLLRWYSRFNALVAIMRLWLMKIRAAGLVFWTMGELWSRVVGKEVGATLAVVFVRTFARYEAHGGSALRLGEEGR